MFDNLTQRLSGIFDRLRGRGALSEADVDAALREVRVALLEADVALPVVKDFAAAVREKAVGQDVLQSISPAQMVIKIVHDHLIQVLGGEGSELNLNAVPPVVILMAGLQGSGKTTASGKIAKFLKDKRRKKVLMASTDVYRPAAREQLEILAPLAGVESLPIILDEKPRDIAKRALNTAKLEGYDVLIIDTAGRLHIDDELMQELKDIADLTQPTEILLVADAMTGQDAVNMAKAFMENVAITGVVLSRIDGDARGGAALSLRAVTGCPIKFLGVGERVDQVEEFHPERIASRILDMGDVLSLVERAVENIDQEEAEKLAKKMGKGTFDLDDLASQLRQMSKMGGLSGLMGFLPGVSKFKDKLDEAGIDDKIINRQLAIIGSMTPKERRNPDLLNASRRKRIASGCGLSVQDVNKLMKQFQDMRNVMKRMNKWGEKGMRRQGLKGLFTPRGM